MKPQYVGHTVAKEKLQELSLSLKRMFKTKRVDGVVHSFAFASYSEANAEEVADYIREAGRLAVVVSSGRVYEVYESYQSSRSQK